LDEFIPHKRETGRLYTELLKDVPGLELPVATTAYAENIYWVYGIVLKEEIAFDADEAMKRLAALGIGCRPFFWPMHRQPVFEKMGLFDGASCPVSERLGARGFYVPSGLAMTNNQVQRAAAALRKLIQ
jgi:perosamine synthetase